MGRGDKIDRQMLHEYLWKISGRNGMLLISQTELAEDLHVTIFTISNIFREMREDGRVTKVGSKYKITDPEMWRWEHNDQQRLI